MNDLALAITGLVALTILVFWIAALQRQINDLHTYVAALESDVNTMNRNPRAIIEDERFWNQTDWPMYNHQAGKLRRPLDYQDGRDRD